MPQSILLIFGLLAITWATPARPATFTGVVREAPSGDRLLVRDGKGLLHTIHLHAVAAPVIGQPYHEASRNALRHLAYKKRVWVDWFEKRRNEEVGKVFLNGEDLAVRLLQRGAVWYDHRQAADQSVADRGLYADAQEQARCKNLGLWRDGHPVEPWSWQKAADRAIASAPAKNRRRARHRKRHRH